MRIVVVTLFPEFVEHALGLLDEAHDVAVADTGELHQHLFAHLVGHVERLLNRRQRRATDHGHHVRAGVESHLSFQPAHIRRFEVRQDQFVRHDLAHRADRFQPGRFAQRGADFVLAAVELADRGGVVVDGHRVALQVVLDAVAQLDDLGALLLGLRFTLRHATAVLSVVAVLVTLVYGRPYARDRDMLRGGEMFTLSMFGLLGETPEYLRRSL